MSPSNIADFESSDAGQPDMLADAELDAEALDRDAMPDAAVERPVLAWAACSVFEDPRLECTTVDVPLRRDVPGSQTIELFVRRLRSDAPDGRSLWLLSGGPGQGGDGFEGLARQLTDLEPGLTVYMPDHRGTGKSTRLGCPAAEDPASTGGIAIVDAEWPDCHAQAVDRYGDGLAGFSTTEAALDLAWLIDRSAEAQPFVLGVSYGTFLAYRYLQIAPDQAAGVIFDSSCAPGVCFLSAQDTWEDRIGRAWFDTVCAADPTCSAKLGPTPTDAIAALHTALDDGHCPILGADPVQGRANLRVVLAQLMLIADLRPAMAALVYRMMRCDVADQRAIGRLINTVFGGNMQPESYSWLLGMNIMVSELWEPTDPSPEALQARYAQTLMCRGVSNLVANQAPAWSRYPEPLLAQPVQTQTPTLMMQAEYDPATPVDIARPMSEALAGVNHRFIIVEHASHTVVSQSPLAADPTVQCGAELLRAFMADPTGALPDCAGATRPPRFDDIPDYSNALYGTSDLWENPAE